MKYFILKPDDVSEFTPSPTLQISRGIAAAFHAKPGRGQHDGSACLAQIWTNHVAASCATPAGEAVLCGWAGIPLLAEVVGNATELVSVPNNSMPHRYGDRKFEKEDIRKLLYVEMPCISCEMTTHQRKDAEPGIAWSGLQNLAAGFIDDAAPVLNVTRMDATSAAQLFQKGKRRRWSWPEMNRGRSSLSVRAKSQSRIRVLSGGQTPKKRHGGASRVVGKREADGDKAMPLSPVSRPELKMIQRQHDAAQETPVWFHCEGTQVLRTRRHPVFEWTLACDHSTQEGSSEPGKDSVARNCI